MTSGRTSHAAASRVTVAVTGPRRRLRWGWWATRVALQRAGARAVYLYPGCPPDRTTGFHGLVVGGGDDLDPGLYGEASTAPVPSDPERDAFEQSVLHTALARDLPILGICRGAQLLNITLGGDLHRDISRDRVKTSNRRTPLPRKSLLLDTSSRLAEFLGVDERRANVVRINSLHHQAIRRCGEGLRVVGRDLDDFVQAVEDPTRSYRLGVQWHPEYLIWQRRQRRLFQALVAAAQSHARKSPAVPSAELTAND